MKAYDYYKMIGICPHCRQMKPATGKVYCPNCLDEQALLQMELRANQSPEKKAEILKKQNESNKERYKRLKAEGICPCCGKRKARPIRVYCAYCAEKQNRYNHIRYQKSKKEDTNNGYN